MNKKLYVGKRVSRFESYGSTRPIDGVALVVDEDNEYLAGDQAGYVLEITCPYGSQAMADELLAKLQGKSFLGYAAQNAVMDPAAELGDGVTVNGVYAPLIGRQVVFGSGHFGEISAPGDRDLDHEYGTGDPALRQIERRLASTRSYIEKTSEEIRLGVESELDERVSQLTVSLAGIQASLKDDMQGLETSLTLELDKLTARVSGAEGSLSSLTQTADKINWLVSSGTSASNFTMTDRAIQLVAEAIDLTGVVTFSDLSTAGKTSINGSNITTGTLNADLIRAGTIRSVDESMQISLSTGDIQVMKDGRGVKITRWDYGVPSIFMEFDGEKVGSITANSNASSIYMTGYFLGRNITDSDKVPFAYYDPVSGDPTIYSKRHIVDSNIIINTGGTITVDQVPGGGLSWETVTLTNGRTCKALCSWS